MRKIRPDITDNERYELVMNIIPTKSYSIGDASFLIGCSIRQVYVMMDDGRLPYIPVTDKQKHRKIKGVHIRSCYLNF